MVLITIKFNVRLRILLLSLCTTCLTGQTVIGNTDYISQAQSDITVSGLRCEYLSEPLGIDITKPGLSWVLNSQVRGQKQTAYQVIVSSTKSKSDENIGDLWDSGKVFLRQSIHVAYDGIDLKSGQDCYWKVRIWDKAGGISRWSKTAHWSMGLLVPEAWRAKWIGLAEDSGEATTLYPLPVFRKRFAFQKEILKAEVSVCGLGQYELFLNGEKVGTDYLAPAWSVYDKTVYYNTYDITHLLREGENAMGVLLGKGFYCTAGDRRIHGVNVDRPLMLILQAKLTYHDGTEELILSDESWKVARGPITHCAILGGSDYDARTVTGKLEYVFL